MGILDTPGYSRTASDAKTRKVIARQGSLRPLKELPPILGTLPTRSLNPAIGTFTSYNLADSLLEVTPKGGSFATYNANGYDTHRNYISPISASAYPSPYYIEFECDDTVDIKFRDNAGSSLAAIWIWVDELDGTGFKRVTTYVESTGANALNGGAQVWRVAFASSIRRIVRVFFKNCEFAGIRHAPTTIVHPTARTELKVALLGDSWMDNASGILHMHSLFYTGVLLLGMEPLNAGQAGTGYMTPTNNANLGEFGVTARVTPIVAAAPDYIIIEGSLNDDINYGPTPANPGAASGTAPPASIQAAATALYAYFATNLPNTKLIVFGPQSLGSPTSAFGDTNANRLANRDAVQTAALAAPNVLGFVDPIAEKWVTGTGNSTATTGIGTSDKLRNSAYHLGAFGHDTLAHRVAASIARILNTA